MTEPSTLKAAGARIDLLGQPLLSELTAETDADRVVLAGDWSALFRLLAGEATLSAGTLQIGGESVPRAVQTGVVGLARLDPLLPSAWTGEQLLHSSAELSGLTGAGARRAVASTLERLSLGSLAARHLGHLQAGERRALLVAHALLTQPRVLCLEQPFLGLDSSAQQLLVAVIEQAIQGRRSLVSVADPDNSPGERELLGRAGAVLRLKAGVVLTDSAESPRLARVTATICRNHEAFARALAARGISAHPTHEAGVLGALTSVGAGPAWRYLVELSDGSTAGVLDAAIETEAGLIELTPS